MFFMPSIVETLVPAVKQNPFVHTSANSEPPFFLTVTGTMYLYHAKLASYVAAYDLSGGRFLPTM
jgi:hypothetical protein